MYLYGIDYTYIIFVVPALILSLIAQVLVKGRFSRFDKIISKRNLTGAQAAQLLLQKNNIYDVKIVHINGQLSDNYNPSKKILSLSDSTYNSTSIAAIGVAAHETGHAIQHAVGYSPLSLRSTLVPAANIGSQFGPTLAVLGIIFGGTSKASDYISIFQLITNIGIILFSLAVLFYIITLPVEFNASSRALRILQGSGLLYEEEVGQARKVLGAAALTYVAGAASAILQLLRLLILTRGRRDD